MKISAQRKMKPSGVDWIGDIPEKWTVMRLKYGVTKIGSGKTPLGGATVYSDDGVLFIRSQNVYDNGLVTEGIEYISPEIDDGMANSRVQNGDVLLNITGGSIGRCCVYSLDKRANVNQHVCIIRVAQSEFLNEYVKYFINGFNKIIVNDNQQGGNRESLNFEQIGNLKICVPPCDEQKRIAAKLDRLCGRVDELAENIKGEIAALQKYRKSLITECVTKGLNPKVKMKPSSVDWIGDIPEKWTVMRTKYVSRVQTGPFGTQLSADSYTEDGSGVPCVNVKNIGDGVFRVDDLDRVQEDVAERLVNYVIKRGDVIFARKGSVDKRTVAEDEQDGWILGSDSIGVRFDEDVMPRYACYYYGNGVMGQHLHKMAKGSTMPSMNAETIGNLEIIIPPLDEQIRIATFLDKRCAVIDAKIAERQRQLEKLGEYRSSVIYEYVTGKREVSA